MKRNNKKGFTIVELVIVIAVIAILAAVLIPTFSNVVRKARISADTQLCKNMNTALGIAEADGKELDTMEDVLSAVNDAGYVIENLNPTTEGYYFAWDSNENRILFLKDDFSVYYPEDAAFNAIDCIITVGSDEEADKIVAEDFSIYLEPEFSNELSLTKLVNVDAGVNKDVNLEIDSSANGSIEVKGDYSNLTIKAENAHVEFNGVADVANVETADNSFVINGYVKTLNVEGGKVKVAKTGVVGTITVADATVKVENKGIIDVITGANDDNVTNSGIIGDEVTANFEYTISNREELYSFRDAVNAGKTFEGITVKLTKDIDLAGVAWLPIGNVYRDNAGKDGNIVGFAGTFDGNGKKITNLSNKGFSVDGLASGRNKTSVGTKNEVVFGLFGCVYNATIKNLTVNANISDAGSGYDGDSVGAIVGYAYGTKLTIINCHSTGSINCLDSVGGLVGRAYMNGGTVTIQNCSNTAKLYARRNDDKGKAGGLVGLIGTNVKNAPAIVFENSTNSGNVAVAEYNGTQRLAANLFNINTNLKINGTLTSFASAGNCVKIDTVG